MPARRTYLIVETHSIAKLFIDALGLKRSDELPKLRAYASETTLLVESRGRPAGGSRAVSAAATVSFLLGRAGHDPATRLFYVGTCAARPGPDAARYAGRVVLANRVVDGLSGAGSYPDILLAHELLEAGIETLARGDGASGTGGDGPGPDAGGSGRTGSGGLGGGPEPSRPGTAASGAAPPRLAAGRPPLVDRELAGVLASALIFLAPHQVYCLAAVTGVCGEDADAGSIVGASMGAILRLMEQAGQLLRPAGGPLSPAAEGAIGAIAAEMRLTAAQRAQLRVLAEGAAARGLDVERVAERGRSAVRTKQERNRGFDELKRLFRQ